jgi:hypothetical protein
MTIAGGSSCRLSFVQVSSQAPEHGRRVCLRLYPARLVLGRRQGQMSHWDCGCFWAVKFSESSAQPTFAKNGRVGPKPSDFVDTGNRLRLDRPPLWLYVLVQRGELGGCQSSEPLSVFAKGRLELGEDSFQLRLLGGYGHGTQFPDSIFQSPEHGGLRQRCS